MQKFFLTVDRFTTRIGHFFAWLIVALTGLICVHLRHRGEAGGEPLALVPGATVTDVAGGIHHELAETCTGARIWGPSARFPGQRVGRSHVVTDGDTVEIRRG